MSHPSCRRAAALWLTLAGTLLCGGPGLADEPSRLGSPDIVRDFMIQNVCLDRSGMVLEGVSPVDGDPRCVGQRDLRPGENLPYHKHDFPAAAERAAASRGYQRHDSFPVETAHFGIVVEHSFDFGGGGGRQFGIFDGGRGDGGDIMLLAPQAVSFAATEDGGAGFQLFVGGACSDRVDAAALARSWIIALAEPNQPLRGETVARLADLRQGRQSDCPSRLNAAFTRWRVQPTTYRSADGQGSPLTLTTLISEHYGGEHPESADHVERFYFTRELGSTRWERWQNLSHTRDFSSDQLTRAATGLALSGRCSKSDMPGGGATLAMVDCREWTAIVPPDAVIGDHAGFFVEAVRSRHLGGDLFSAPNSAEKDQ
jgi:hypothetical protein